MSQPTTLTIEKVGRNQWRIEIEGGPADGATFTSASGQSLPSALAQVGELLRTAGE